jgi:hypothetical protein
MINYGTYTDAYSRKLCKQYGFTSGVRFTLKVHMVTNPGTAAFLIVFSSTLVLSLLMSIFERPYNIVNGKTSQSIEDFGDGLYLVVMTMTTVGYGDFTPHTYTGKYLAMITALWGSFLISILVLATASFFELNKN